MAKGLYVLQVYTGYENKVEKFVRLLMEDSAYTEQLTDVKVLTEDVVEVKDGKKRTVSKKFLPPNWIKNDFEADFRTKESKCTSYTYY